jgi:SH3-like domain-containing protein
MKLAFCFAALISATVSISPAQAQGRDGTFVVTVVNVPGHGTVNVRKQARNGAAVIGKLNEGAQTFADGSCWNGRFKKLFSVRNGMPSNNANVWCQVQTTDGQLGWVLVKYLDIPL